MDKTIQQTLKDIYIDHKENKYMSAGIAQEIADNIDDSLKKIQGITYEIFVDDNKGSYKKIDFDTYTIAVWVAIDNSSKHKLDVLISKLGKFAMFRWWRRKFFFKVYSYDLPESWSSNLINEIKKGIENSGVVLIDSKNLTEQHPDIPSDKYPQTVVGELLFFD